MTLVISLAVAARNFICRDCAATVNLKKLSDVDRRRWFACGLCPVCYPQLAGRPAQGELFDVL